MLDIFDILGPVMIGPSSSHTAGAAKIGAMPAHCWVRRRSGPPSTSTAPLPRRAPATARTVRW